MKVMSKFGLILFTVVCLSSAVLAFINTLTEPQIVSNRLRAQCDARRHIFPEAEYFEEISTPDFTFFKAINDNQELLGFTFTTVGKGWSGGDIVTMVGLFNDMTINRITILRHSETPGLGANATRPDFLSRFENKTQKELFIDRDGGKIQSITGATVTARVIVNSIRNYIDKLIKALEYVSKEYDDETN